MWGVRWRNALRRCLRTPTARTRPPAYGVPRSFTARLGCRIRRWVFRETRSAKECLEATAKDFVGETSSSKLSSKKETKYSVASDEVLRGVGNVRDGRVKGPTRSNGEVINV